jgi:hypothetical protein
MSLDRLMDVKEVAAALGVSEDLARDVMKRLRPVRIGTGPRPMIKIRERALERWINNGGDAADVCKRDEDQDGDQPTTVEPIRTRVGSVASRLTPIVPRTQARTPEAAARFAELNQRKTEDAKRLKPIDPRTKPRAN